MEKPIGMGDQVKYKDEFSVLQKYGVGIVTSVTPKSICVRFGELTFVGSREEFEVVNKKTDPAVAQKLWDESSE